MPLRWGKYLHTMHKVHFCRRWENRWTRHVCQHHQCIARSLDKFLLLQTSSLLVWCRGSGIHQEAYDGHIFFIISSRKFYSVISMNITTTPCTIGCRIRIKMREEKMSKPNDSHWLILPYMKRDCFKWKMQILVYENKYCTSQTCKSKLIFWPSTLNISVCFFDAVFCISHETFFALCCKFRHIHGSVLRLRRVWMRTFWCLICTQFSSFVQFEEIKYLDKLS